MIFRVTEISTIAGKIRVVITLLLIGGGETKLYCSLHCLFSSTPCEQHSVLLSLDINLYLQQNV
jgi:hypothetical protein